MRKKQTKKVFRIKVPIFTEEYSIIVVIGTRTQLFSVVAKYLEVSTKAVENDFGGCRGRAWNALDDVYKNKHPIIAINGDLPNHVALATLAHEASHAMDFIGDFIGIKDTNGEFHAHGISAVMRAVLLLIIAKKIV
jgi:hypothetical protein